MREVSTHSRPKAAGLGSGARCPALYPSFNSQPPEGGWEVTDAMCREYIKFQLTAARRRLVFMLFMQLCFRRVSTHSRPKAAGIINHELTANNMVSTHSRPKAAGRFIRLSHFLAGEFQLTAARRRLGSYMSINAYLTAFQLTAARRRLVFIRPDQLGTDDVSTHSRPKAAGASAETLNRQGLHCPVSLRFH